MAGVILAALIQVSVVPSQPMAFQQAYRQSVSTGRPLVVLLGADWCPGCRVMKTNILPTIAKAGGLANVEFVYINIDHQRRLVEKLTRSKAIPQLICFRKTPAGWERRCLTGAHSVKEVNRFINNGPIRNPVVNKLGDDNHMHGVRTIGYSSP